MQGGSQAIIDTLVKGLEKNGGTLSLRTRARRVLRGVDSDSSSDSSKSSDTSGGGATSSSKPSNAESLLGGVKRMLQSAMGGSSSGDPLDTAVAVEVVGPDGCPKVVKVRQAVISNASVWDTERILTTTGEVKHDSLSTPKVAERVLQQAAARGAEQEASAAVQREGASGARGASQLTAVESVESDGSGSTQTAAAVLDRLNGSIRLSSNKRDSFDSQSLRNPADAATASSEGVLDSMGSIDSDDWTNSESCSWEAPVGQDSKWLREDFLSYVRDLEMNASMMHLHVGFEAREGVLYDVFPLYALAFVCFSLCACAVVSMSTTFCVPEALLLFQSAFLRFQECPSYCSLHNADDSILAGSLITAGHCTHAYELYASECITRPPQRRT